MKLSMHEIDTTYYDRVAAIIVANGKMYISGADHQDAFEMYCEDIGIDSGLDWSDPDCFDETHEKAIELTDGLFFKNEIQGFDIFEGDEGRLYLTAHYPENLEKVYDIIIPYAKENNYIVGTFYNNKENIKLLMED